MRSLLLLGVAVLVAGCLEPSPAGPAPDVRPADWDQGEALLAYDGFRAHSADEEQSLVPSENSTLARPAYCGAYQDGERSGRDTCTVEAAEVEGGRTWGPWTLVATWDGRGEELVETEQAPERRTVVAFDEAGTPVAWWAGERHPEGWMAIE